MGYSPPFSDYDYHDIPQKVDIVSNRLITADLEELEQKCLNWDRLFNMACHDRDTWQQQCVVLETVVSRQRDEMRKLQKELRLYVDAAYKFRDEVLEATVIGDRIIVDSDPFQCAQKTEPETQRISETTRNEGQDSGEAPDSRPAGGDSEGLTP